MIDIMNTSSEDATPEDILDSDVKDGYAFIEAVEVQETVVSMDSIKIPKKVTAELQECAGAPLINGQGTVCKTSVLPEFYKISSVSSHNEQLQKITGASENDVDTRIENGTGEGTISQPFNAIGPGKTLNASMNKELSSVPGDVEPPSGSEQEESAAVVSGRNELQDAIQTKPEDSVIQGGVNAVQNHIFQENGKYPIENGPSNPAVVQKPIAIPAEDLLITSVGERTQRSVNSFTGEKNDTIGRDDSAGVEDHDNLGPNEITKKRKLTVTSHENPEIRSTIEPNKMGTAKTEEKRHQTVRIGSGQLIAFTRRKRKHLCSHRPDP